MYFITCFDSNWLQNCRYFAGLDTAPCDAEGRALPHREMSHCFGYFATKGDALAAVKRNCGDIHECSYTHCVVEYLAPGIHAIGGPRDQTWFGWKDSAEFEGQWEEVPQPSETFQLLNFALG